MIHRRLISIHNRYLDTIQNAIRQLLGGVSYQDCEEDAEGV